MRMGPDSFFVHRREATMTFDAPLVPGTLIQRYKRFLADIQLEDGTVVTAHCANSGSMLGCAPAGAPVLLTRHDDPKRKLKYGWELVRIGGTWVGVNTARPNHLVKEAILAGRIPELCGYATLEMERQYGVSSRIDLLLSRPDGARCYVEVKNVTLVEGDCALFPDSVTARGTKHLHELSAQVRLGDRAVMLFLVQRGDCVHFRPAADIDPVYATTLIEAAAAGVELLCYACDVGPEGISVAGPLPISL
jgi:sugar fermentation stimulation protein A